ncbi:hypothetical protein LWI28_004772 [Acer negundo]|uniref:Pentatricopeptide repeat-containing protein n=1 Tax=Acer negundo TaxID=4023 RepID=A0AAD5IFI9_ACENE|nr:hypothetical protein LWI28_004772 [Acer negundo]
MITSYIVAGELENAQALFNEMIIKGQLPNVFTYNSMIRGFCMAGRGNMFIYSQKSKDIRDVRAAFCNKGLFSRNSIGECLFVPALFTRFLPAANSSVRSGNGYSVFELRLKETEPIKNILCPCRWFHLNYL